MKPELSQDYTVDGRYHAGKNSIDNTQGRLFVRSYIQRKRDEQNPNMAGERSTEDRFIIRGPGDSGYTFRNSFRASK